MVSHVSFHEFAAKQKVDLIFETMQDGIIYHRGSCADIVHKLRWHPITKSYDYKSEEHDDVNSFPENDKGFWLFLTMYLIETLGS